MRLMNNTLTDAMAGNIISVGSELGVDLSASDVKNIAIINKMISEKRCDLRWWKL